MQEIVAIVGFVVLMLLLRSRMSREREQRHNLPKTLKQPNPTVMSTNRKAQQHAEHVRV